MLRRLLIAIAFVLLAPGALAADRIFDAAGKRWGVPPVFLKTIASIESSMRPWSVNVNGEGWSFDSKDTAMQFLRYVEANPWILKVRTPEGKTRHRRLFPSKAAATAAYRSMAIQSGYRVRIRKLKVVSTDIGMMQVNWMHHRDQVGSVSRLFDIDFNVQYAARYLRRQYDVTGDWLTAVAYYYNNRDKAAQEAYLARFRSALRQIRGANS